MSIILRNERAGDESAIFELTRQAFLTAEHTCHSEQFIVGALRRYGHLALSRLAVDNETAVGHVAFSPLQLPNGEAGWYGVGPLSVLPGYQRRGIGTRLMQSGMASIGAAGARGCVLVGDPDFYSRLGFTSSPDLTLSGVPPQYLLAYAFDGVLPTGEIAFSPAFGATG